MLLREKIGLLGLKFHQRLLLRSKKTAPKINFGAVTFYLKYIFQNSEYALSP